MLTQGSRPQHTKPPIDPSMRSRSLANCSSGRHLTRDAMHEARCLGPPPATHTWPIASLARLQVPSHGDH